jgi:hypothetical protein
MGEFAAIAAVVSSAASVFTAFSGAQAAQQQGRLARQEAEVQAQQIAEQREAVAAAARQEEAARLVTLRRTLGAAAAIRGARGLSGDSLGADVLRTESEAEAAKDLDTIAINAEREGRSLGLAQSRALLSGQSAVSRANSQALAGYGQAISGAFSLGNQGYKFLSSR